MSAQCPSFNVVRISNKRGQTTGVTMTLSKVPECCLHVCSVFVAKHGPRSQFPRSVETRIKEFDTCVQVFSVRKLGCVHDRQPTMILQVSFSMRRKEK